MQIDLSRLFEQDGSHLDLTVPFETESIQSYGEKYDVADKSDIALTVVHKTKGQFEVKAECQITLKMRCGRCLEPVDEKLQITAERDFDLNGSKEELDESPYVSGYSLDVDLLVMDELYLNIPISVLCSEDCKGLCQKCGINLNHGSCDCDTTVLDPRMAKILDIYNAHNKEV